MGFVRHILICAIYTGIAAAVAIVVPLFAPGIATASAVMAGGLVLLGAALFHEVLARQGDYGRLAAELGALREAQRAVNQEIVQARAQLGGIHDAFAEAARRTESKAPSSVVDRLEAEVRVLGSVIRQLAAAPRESAPKRPGETAVLRAIRDDEFGKAGGPGATDSASRHRADPGTAGGEASDDAQMLDIIRDALRSDRVDLVLQPVVSLPQRRRCYFEAFTRIRAVDGTAIMPERYIGLAEREGLITAIDNMLLFRTVQLVRRNRRRDPEVAFFCNVSAHTLGDETFFRDFVDFVADNDDLSPNVVFEFSQSAIVDAAPELVQHLDRLAAMGFRLSIDQTRSLRFDIETLQRRRIKFVKIDARSLLAEARAMGPPEAFARFKHALDLAGVKLIVDKVESEEVVRELLDYAVEFGQGYLFGEPRVSRAA